MTLLDKIKKGLVDSFNSASDLTSEYTRLGRIKIEMLGIKKEIEEKMLELGGRSFELYKNSQLDNFGRKPEINQLFIEIAELEEELKEYEEKWRKIKESE